MKKLFGIMFIALSLVYVPVVEAAPAAKTKVICKAKQKCKTIKLHKKLDGKKIPQPTKKK